MTVFQGLVNALVLEGDSNKLSHGTLRVERFENENATHAELLTHAIRYSDPEIRMEFRTATCIEEAGEVTTMFPHRGAVFSSLVGKWCRSASEKYELDPPDEIVQELPAEMVDFADTENLALSYEPAGEVLLARVETLIMSERLFTYESVLD